MIMQQLWVCTVLIDMETFSNELYYKNRILSVGERERLEEFYMSRQKWAHAPSDFAFLQGSQ